MRERRAHRPVQPSLSPLAYLWQSPNKWSNEYCTSGLALLPPGPSDHDQAPRLIKVHERHTFMTLLLELACPSMTCLKTFADGLMGATLSDWNPETVAEKRGLILR